MAETRTMRSMLASRVLSTTLFAAVISCGNVQQLTDASTGQHDSAASDSPNADDAAMRDSGCVPSCNGDVLTTCATDGGPSTITCDLGCNGSGGADGTKAECNILSPSNLGSLSSTICDPGSSGSTGSDLNLASGVLNIQTDGPDQCDAIVTQPDGPSLCVKEYPDINIATGAVINAFGSNALVLVATGQITFDGRLNANSTISGSAGPGASFASGAGQSSTSIDGGGGGGGGATAGAASTGGGAGGVEFGTDAIIPLVAGAAGGAQEGGTAFSQGGGAVELVSCHAVSIGATASFNLGGAGGVGAREGGGRGGGGGGNLLIEGSVVTVSGGIFANGGGGGGGGARQGTISSPGNDGSDGQASIVAAEGGPAQGAASGGGQGGVSDASPSVGLEGVEGDGGGGGAVGRLRINVRSQTSPNLSSATISALTTSGSVAVHTAP